MGKINIVEYNKKHRLGSILLLENVFPGSSSEATFNWRFESPDREQPLIICALDDKKVVCFNSWIEWEFLFNGTKYKGFQSGESATDRSYRRMGIFENVLKHADAKAAERGIDFLFGFPSSMSYGAVQNAGYTVVGEWRHKIRLISPIGRTRQVAELEDITEYSKTQVYDNLKISPITDHNYLSWRYRKNPKKYDIVIFKKDNNKALFVLRRSKYFNKRLNIGWNEVLLMDCAFSCTDKEFTSKAFNYVDSVYRKKAVWIRNFFNRHSTRGKIISPYFHLSTRYSEVLILKLINEKLDKEIFQNLDNWDIQPHVVDAW